MNRIRLATRGSPLALWQAETVKATLLAARPDIDVELVLVRTIGDKNTRTDLSKLGDTGVFTKEVDREILEGRADAAVHSLKDQETTLADGLVLGMVLPRGPVEDAFISPSGKSFRDLLAGARVATGSLRRQAQLLAIRTDVEIVGIRGNVDGRLKKLDDGAADALVMARAGLERLGLDDRIAHVFPVHDMLPAPSQGIVGITCLENATAVRECLAEVDHAETRASAEAERALLRTLGGGCNVPVGAMAIVNSDTLTITARVLSIDGTNEVAGEREGPCKDAESLGIELAAEFMDRGAKTLIEEARA